jgi:hypothetical protein
VHEHIRVYVHQHHARTREHTLVSHTQETQKYNNVQKYKNAQKYKNVQKYNNLQKYNNVQKYKNVQKYNNVKTIQECTKLQYERVFFCLFCIRS